MFLARLLVLLTLNNKTETLHDPCCGTGTIARATYDIKKEVGISTKESLKSIFASDKVAFPLQMATLAISEPTNFGEIIQVFKKDCSELSIGEDIEFRNPFDGSVINRKYYKINNIASNLPFIKQEDLKKLNPEIQNKINKLLNEKFSKKDKLNEKSDLYAYLPFTFWDILSENGKLGIIVSNSWLGTDWGEKFKKFLTRFYKLDYVLTSSTGRWFQNADVVTNIVILTKREFLIDKLPNTEKTKFITISHDFLDDSNYENIREIYQNIITNTLDKRFKVEEYSTEEILSEPLNWNTLFSDISWIKQINKKLIFCSTLFEIKRGARRGWDDMFYPSSNHGIEQDFIKPVLKSSRDIDSLTSIAESEAFCCSLSIEELSQKGNTGAIAWINKFKYGFNEVGKPLPEVLKIKNGYWYTMHDTEMADFVTSVNPDKRIFISRLNEKSFVNQRLIRFTSLKFDTDLELSHALLNSLMGIFFIEALGFGRGLGALDIS